MTAESGRLAEPRIAHIKALTAAGLSYVSLPERSNQRQSHEFAGLGLASIKGARIQRAFFGMGYGNWRMTFKFDGTDAVLVDYQDYQ